MLAKRISFFMGVCFTFLFAGAYNVSANYPANPIYTCPNGGRLSQSNPTVCSYPFNECKATAPGYDGYPYENSCTTVPNGTCNITQPYPVDGDSWASFNMGDLSFDQNCNMTYENFGQAAPGGTVINSFTYWAITNSSIPSQPSYNATLAYYCPRNIGGTLSGTTCITTCGTANGQYLYSSPVGNSNFTLCASGTTSAVSGSGPWNWDCSGTQCVANKATDGSCGSSNGQYFSSAPTSNFCGPGSNFSGLWGNGPWTWSCIGNGGTTAFCMANLTGNCGSDNGQYLYSSPTHLCSSGTASAVSNTTSGWSWTCSTTQCSATKKYDCGRCSNANSYAWATFQSADPTCNDGPIPGTQATYSLNCSCGAKASDPFGFTSACTAAPINGTCGPSHNQTFTTAPTSGFCNTGSFSGLSGSGPWSWSCIGSNGGSTANCQTSQLPTGSCGSDNGKDLYSQPINLCQSGNQSALTITASGWTWTCGSTQCGANKKYACSKCSNVNSYALANFDSYDSTCASGPIPGTSATYLLNCSCGEKMSDPFNFTPSCTSSSTNGQCGSSNGQTFSSQPTTNLCLAGNVALMTETASGWTWSCNGTNGGSNANCSAQKPVISDGICGSSNGKILDSKPSTNLCSVGTASEVSGSGPWNWSCSGINGGATVNCQAISSADQWIEVAP